MMHHVLPILLSLFCLGHGRAAPQVFTKLEQCSLVSTEWADGDSFLVKTQSGTELTVRLYGVDCLEYHVTDQSDARRLRAQRRYFGIAGFGGNPQASITHAKNLGKLAAAETSKLLAEPFTLYTTYADARGDGKYKRVYGFIYTSPSKDLAEILVSRGLARAYGVYRSTPILESSSDYRSRLQDTELRAAKLGLGAWKHTDWEKLLPQRREQRDEESELNLAVEAKKDYSGKLLNPNTAARDELMQLPGIGETMANRIIEGRPYKSFEDLDKIDGIGKKTLVKLMPYLVLGEDSE